MTLTLIAAVTGAALVFWRVWKFYDDDWEMANRPEDEQKFLGIRFVRGFDGKRHLVALPWHLRIAVSLIPSLVTAVLTLYIARLIWGV